MNEIKTLAEIGEMVNAGNEIIVLGTVTHDGARYVTMQDNTAQTCYSVELE